jgi:hypothetical protein
MQRPSEVVLFEIPLDTDIGRFCARLRPLRTGCPRLDHDAWLVAAEAPNGAGVATLLGDVRAMLPEFGLESIRYCHQNTVFELTRRPTPA